MNYSKLFFATLLYSSVFLAACSEPKNEENTEPVAQEQNHETDLKMLIAANDSFYSALNAMFVGDMTGMNAIWSHRDYVTQMGPFGGRLTGWEKVGADFQQNADMKFGGAISCKDMHAYVGNGMGYTTCVEEGENLDSTGTLMKVRHRATNVFELQDGAWKMIHHQTDLSQQLEDSYEEAVHEEVE